MKKAFTLAEVLTTLGIIGIVAAMTMPMLLANSREKELVSKLKKSYSVLSQSFALAIVENNTPNYWLDTPEEDNGGAAAMSLQEKLTPYYHISKDCKGEGGCWPNQNILNLDGTSSGLNFGTDRNYSTFRIADGTLYALRIVDTTCETSRGTDSALQKVCAEMFIDVTGPKKPNQLGYDVYKFYIVRNGVYPAGMSGDTTHPFDTQCLRKVSGLGCAAWVLRNSNVDYLHCKDIGWNGKPSCKNIFNYNHSTGL